MRFEAAYNGSVRARRTAPRGRFPFVPDAFELGTAVFNGYMRIRRPSLRRRTQMDPDPVHGLALGHGMFDAATMFTKPQLFCVHFPILLSPPLGFGFATILDAVRGFPIAEREIGGIAVLDISAAAAPDGDFPLAFSLTVGAADALLYAYRCEFETRSHRRRVITAILQVETLEVDIPLPEGIFNIDRDVRWD